MKTLIPWVPLLPLVAAIFCWVGGKRFGRLPSAVVAIGAVGISFVLSCIVAYQQFSTGTVLNYDWYTWAQIGDLKISIGFLVDGLSSVMLLVVTFVSLMVHIYTMGYMHDDPGYQRFFAYIALFTFAMLMLVLSNNFLQLFFGWEAVGLVSYLLIGFWYTKPTAIFANLKAFLVNRVGDFGFLIGIGLVLAAVGTLNYLEVFEASAALKNEQLRLWDGLEWSLITVICLTLFVGAMGKSAQFPLHVWLPDSMEGPTPISALIHAATMVTAGIFMVARMAPLFELSDTALATVMVIGALTAFFMGLLGLIQNDIKRVVAYSTISQLGYMTCALGASAYSVAIFHLTTHAFFKALLFLGAGAVIVALHHEQDMRNMGGLRKKMPITHLTMLIGSVALCGIPPLAGFFSKDLIILAVGNSELGVAQAVQWALIASAFVTSFYSFRLMALVFTGTPRMEQKAYDHVKDCAWTITVPLVLLAIPSVFAGWLLMQPMVFGDWLMPTNDYVTHGTLEKLIEDVGSAWALVAHSVFSPVFWAAVLGVVGALYIYLAAPALANTAVKVAGPLYYVMQAKYGLDAFNERVLAAGCRKLAHFLWQWVDHNIIDGMVNGIAYVTSKGALALRNLQTGRIYHYAFVMIVCVLAFSLWRVRGG